MSNPVPSTSRQLIIKLTTGVESPEKLSQAFTVAATAVASGARVSLWLTGESTWLALPGRAEQFSLPHAANLADLRDAVIADGTLTVCSQCAARRDLGQADLLPGTLVRGAAAFVEEVLAHGAQALVY
ncbi:MAG TPA: DsrE family protein [Dermatophilaceae bacterium]|jgi:predicted peroxiredoxin